MKFTDDMIFSHYQTRVLIEKSDRTISPLSADLGLSNIQVEKTNSGWRLPDKQILTFAQIQIINEDKNSCFLFKDGQLRKVEFFSEMTYRYYSLMPTEKSPTMLISGIPMHRIKNTTPVDDTKLKMRALGRPYGIILDTSTGLGYTAIQAAKSADRVITIEFDPVVLNYLQIQKFIS
jgi:predicted methyltransferase